jgi:hypothetical protein
MPGSQCSVRFRLGLILFAFLLPLSAGCITDYIARLRGPGFDDGSKRLTSEVPARENAGKPFGFSTKAQEIEANLGYR